jgi:mannose-1-phosphate guanylyltransferase
MDAPGCDVGRAEALPGRLWAVVLAGGDGMRVSALTRGTAGEPVPKQYCALGSDGPLLQQALRRAAAIVPRGRTLVVVAEHHRRHWQEMLSDFPAGNVIVQPRNRGTAAGILLPVLDIVLRRDRDARVLVLPADHHVGQEVVLRQALLAAVRAVRRPDAPLVLLGVPGEDGDGEYGWILPSARTSACVRSVLSFIEKPDPETSCELAALGALVNTFIFAARGRALIQLYEDGLPELLRPFVPVVLAGSPDRRLRELYRDIPSCDFSRAVLERCVGPLAVLAVPPCGWSDVVTGTVSVPPLGIAVLDRRAGDHGALRCLRVERVPRQPARERKDLHAVSLSRIPRTVPGTGWCGLDLLGEPRRRDKA